MIGITSTNTRVSAMCKVLQLSRSTYYYEAEKTQSEDERGKMITEILRINRHNYGTRKFKGELKKKNMIS